MSMTAADARHEVRVENVEYQRQGGRPMLARLYRPSGAGPFPALVQVHGGAWVNKDRTDNDFIAKSLAESGIFVASLDFRMPPEAPYPASLADINLGARWLKANAGEYRSRPDWVGSFGTSSGGHQVLLAAMRPTTRAIVRYGWPTRRRSTPGSPLSSRAGACSTRCCGTSSRKRPATPTSSTTTTISGATRRRWRKATRRAMLDRGEPVHLPPALVFGGDKDEWVPVEVMRKFVADYQKAGGEVELQLYEGANHGFMTGKPDAPYAARALDRMKAFIRKHTSG